MSALLGHNLLVTSKVLASKSLPGDVEICEVPLAQRSTPPVPVLGVLRVYSCWSCCTSICYQQVQWLPNPVFSVHAQTLYVYPALLPASVGAVRILAGSHFVQDQLQQLCPADVNGYSIHPLPSL